MPATSPTTPAARSGARRPVRRLAGLPAGPLAARWRWPVVATSAVVGLGAVYGGTMLLLDPVGLGVKDEWLDGSPFDGYAVPGATLLVVVAGGFLATGAAALARHGLGRAAALLMAAVLVAWGVVETASVGWHGASQGVLLGAFVALPAAILALAARRGPGG